MMIRTWIVCCSVCAGCSHDFRLRADGGTPSDVTAEGSEVPRDTTPDTTEACVPGTTRCENDDVLTCEANGTESRSSCALGCGAADRCRTMLPSNLPENTCSFIGTLGDLEGSLSIDTNTDCDERVGQPDGPQICVLRYNTVDLPADAIITASGTYPLAIVATRSIRIAGTIDVSGTETGPGPGTQLSGQGTDGAVARSGGGGAGHGTAGASGFAAPAGGGEPGPIVGTESLVPLRGGARGGDGGPHAIRARGGDGGGAVQLVSCKGALNVDSTARIFASGSGGGGGNGAVDPGGGGGGGSGGAVLLEAAQISFAADTGVIADGGGGGGGGGGGLNGLDGAEGFWIGRAPGGGGGFPVGGPGGDGGAADGDRMPLLPVLGGIPLDLVAAGGGGGGAAGRIRLNVRANTSPTTTEGTFSPMYTSGSVATAD